MLFSIRTERALVALGRLAAMAMPGERVFLEDILDGTDAPRPFLSKLFTRLSRAGIVQSVRGRFGGYSLAKPAERITLREVVAAIEAAGAEPRSPFRLIGVAPRDAYSWEQRWQPVRVAISDFLERTTLADLRDEIARGSGGSGNGGLHHPAPLAALAQHTALAQDPALDRPLE